MPVPRCEAEYLPTLLAWDLNFLPDDDACSEQWDIGGDEHVVQLASFTIDSSILFKYDVDW